MRVARDQVVRAAHAEDAVRLGLTITPEAGFAWPYELPMKRRSSTVRDGAAPVGHA